MLLICISACNQNGYEIKDGGFLSNDPCGPPCFLGISPNRTRAPEVTEILNAKKMLQECQPYNNESASGSRGFSCVTIGIGIRFQKGTDIVGMVGFQPSDKITVGKIIAKYGNPDTVSVGNEGIPEHPTVGMSLFYSDIQTVIGLVVQQGTLYNLDASTQAQAINYFDILSFSEQRRSGHWRGYGIYKTGE